MNLPPRWHWLWTALVVVVNDQVSKLAIVTYTPEDYHRVIIPGVFNLAHRHNTGVAFSMFADVDSPWLARLLILFSFVVMAVLVFLLATGRASNRRTRLGLAAILGGAAGNLLDRLVHGSVVDFLDFHAGPYHWPAFNLADSAITVGAFIALLDLMREPHSPAPKQRE